MGASVLSVEARGANGKASGRGRQARVKNDECAQSPHFIRFHYNLSIKFCNFFIHKTTTILKDGGHRMNEQIFHRLYDHYHKDVFQFLIYLTKDRLTAEDLSHEVYIRAIKSYGSFRQDASEKTWLFAIAKNVAIDHFRKQKVRNQYGGDGFEWEKEQLISESPSPEYKTMLNEETRQVFDALELCTGDQKIVILLRYIQQMSIQETAEILNWTEAKVKTTQHRAIQRLRETLTKLEGRGTEHA